MNIKSFKVGDIVTRNEGMLYEHRGIVDGSYTGERLIVLGLDVDSEIIFLEYDGDIISLSYARDAWDEGWVLYPETLWQKIKKMVLP